MTKTNHPFSFPAKLILVPLLSRFTLFILLIEFQDVMHAQVLEANDGSDNPLG